MSTLLELCQQTAEESGTFPTIGQPETVDGQTGRMQRLINWVIRAHTDIQRSRRDWRWLQTEFSGSTIASTQTYDAAAMMISERFAHWLHQDDHGYDTFSLYLPSDTQASEGYLGYVDWPEFRRQFMIGTNATLTGKPAYISVNDQRELVLYPIPDDAYTLRGRYYKAPQTLALDADIPEMPEQFHEIIVWRALMRLGTYDEAIEQLPEWKTNQRAIMAKLVQDQTPRIVRAEALA